MEIDFSDLLKEDDQSPIHPREVFLTLERHSSFSFLRDVQADVLDQWFDARTNRDTVIKLNVGSGKTVVGLLVLQSSINEGAGPCVFVSPDNLLVEQTVTEARRLGIDITTDETDGAFRRGERILAVNIHKIFNGRSVFGVGTAGTKIPIGMILPH